MEQVLEDITNTFEGISLSGTGGFQCEKIKENDLVVRELSEKLFLRTPTWYDGLFTLDNVDLCEPEYKRLSKLFHGTLPLAKIKKIEHVINPYLHIQFELTKMQKCAAYGGLVKVHTLFHGTKASNIVSICSNNFDWRKNGANGFIGFRFGRGVCFSPKASYSSAFPRSYYEDSPRIMFAAEVLEVRRCDGCWDLKIPPDDCDTATGNKEDVIVKFSDNEFYPGYIIYYDLN